MNVDEAMEEARQFGEQESKDMLFAEHIAILLAAEVERLRAELDETKRWLDERSEAYGKTCSIVDQLQTELAAAKAASECPARVENIYDAEYPSDCYIECWNGDECLKFREWLYDRMKDKTPPEA